MYARSSYIMWSMGLCQLYLWMITQNQLANNKRWRKLLPSVKYSRKVHNKQRSNNIKLNNIKTLFSIQTPVDWTHLHSGVIGASIVEGFKVTLPYYYQRTPPPGVKLSNRPCTVCKQKSAGRVGRQDTNMFVVFVRSLVLKMYELFNSSLIYYLNCRLYLNFLPLLCA